MRAIRLEAVDTLVPRDLERPEPGPGEVLLRIEACGLCGSDRHMLRGEFPTAKPVTLGHEFAGIVEAVGPGVTRLAPGMRVTGDPNICCGECPQCRRGRPNLCERLSAIGVWRDGGFADYLVMPEGQGHVLPDDLPPLHGAFGEPLSCCLHAIDVARIAPGDSVVVLGGGIIGMLMVQLARREGAGRVVLVTRQAPRRALAERIGADASVDPTVGDAVTAIAGPAGLLRGGADLVIECAGVAQTFTQAPQLARRGGAVVVFGVMPQGEPAVLIPWDLLTKELRIEAAWLNPLTHARAAELVATRALDLDSLITRAVPLEDVPAILAAPIPFGEIKTIAVPTL
jgi:threonine dehydrogenase-like Zn-dependent dehydrogenase